MAMAAKCEYVAQLNETAGLVADAVGVRDWKLVYQSRSGSPQQPWLEPDICDYLKQLKGEGVTDVVVSPIGFVSDHMEVIYDLDVEARKVSQDIGLTMVRAATAGTQPSFVKMVRELILERVDGLERRYLGNRGVAHDFCPVDCCLPS
jgi:ferrochelatase